MFVGVLPGIRRFPCRRLALLVWRVKLPFQFLWMMNASAEDGAERVVSRRRLRGKQCLGQRLAAPSVPAVVAEAVAVTSSRTRSFSGVSAACSSRDCILPRAESVASAASVVSPTPSDGFDKHAYTLLWKRFSRWIHQHGTDAELTRFNECGLRRPRGEPLSVPQREMLARFLQNCGNLPEAAKEVGAQLVRGAPSSSGFGNFGSKSGRPASKLYALNGAWGLVPREIFTPSDVVVDVDTVASAVMTSDWFSHLRASFVTWLLEFVETWHVSEYAWCAEVSPTTICAPALHVRLHFHVCFRAPHPVHAMFGERLFQNVSPPIASLLVGERVRGAARGYHCFFYTQAQKRGRVDGGGNVTMFKDYLVQGDWILQLLQGEKITCAVARSMSVHTVRNLPGMLRTLSAFETASAEEALASHVRAVQAELRQGMCSFKHIDVVAEWLAEFDVLRARYHFLILDGPSCVGKSQFACSLASHGSVCFCDCQSAQQPDLRSFRPLQDEVIVMDEASPSLVIRNKRLFQAPAEWVQLGLSATNMYSYRQWVHRTKIVVCCNDWIAGLNVLSASEKKWIHDNSRYHFEDDKLWIPHSAS